MYHKYLIISLLTLCFYDVLSQQSVATKAMDIPQKFVLPVGDQDIEDGEKLLSGNIWEVYSDRTYNKTTNKPSGGGVCKIIQYLDKYYVAERKKRYLHLIKDQNIGSDGTFSDESEDFGWISAENLLLWGHCLVDEDGRNKRVFLFKNESTENYFINNNDNQSNNASFFQVLYVFKEEKDRTLLAVPVRLFGNQEAFDKDIIGWVNNDKFVSFESNTFLAPNQIGNYLTDNDASNILNPIFFDRKSVKKLIAGKDISPTKILWSRNVHQELKPTTFRFPFLNSKDSIAEVLIYYPKLSHEVGQFNIDPEYRDDFNRGYCSIANSYTELSYMKVLLFSKAELINLLDMYEIFISISDGSHDSLTIVNEFRSFFQIENSISNTMVLNTTIETFLNKKYGCCSSNQYNIKKLRTLFIDETKKYDEYFQVIKNNFRIVNTIFNDKSSKISFSSNGLLYYWIPCSYIQ